ncbi:MAG TPA: hypothetical protein VGR69_10615 [Candidatus Rubrimentiphilum sp.]|nr:hypothetical protein [Candidatus Rubrimentiphilum sp.]
METQEIQTGQIPAIEDLIVDAIARLSLAAHVFISDEEGKQSDLASAEIAIDVAASAYERVKERLKPEQRLAITQLLTETRMSFVKKRGV